MKRQRENKCVYSNIFLISLQVVCLITQITIFSAHLITVLSIVLSPSDFPPHRVMSFNSSNTSLLPPHLLSSNSSFKPTNCFYYRSSFFSFLAFSVTNILLLLPLCLFVFYLGLQRWQKRHLASAAAKTSHSDIFTYHMVAMEMIGVFGCGLYCCGTGFNNLWLTLVGLYSYSAISYGELLFHILTCVERYLAVVHPITYLGLRNRGGVRIRNITIGCVWLLLCGSYGLVSQESMIPALCIIIISMLIVSFCSLSVLCALIRPGPGDGAKDKDDQTKIRAFHTIMAITGALLFRLGGHVLALAIFSSPSVNHGVRCAVLVSGIWFGLPSSLVLPLLFLHRAGKLLCCKKNTESGHGSE